MTEHTDRLTNGHCNKKTKTAKRLALCLSESKSANKNVLFSRYCANHIAKSSYLFIILFVLVLILVLGKSELKKWQSLDQQPVKPPGVSRTVRAPLYT